MKIVKLHGETVRFYTVGELAKYCGRSANYFRELTRKNVLPAPNWRTKSKEVSNGKGETYKMNGDALYSVDFLAPKLKAIFKHIRRGKSISSANLQDIAQAFIDEKQFYSNNK